MKELRLEELTAAQKCGMAMVAHIFFYGSPENQQRELDYVLDKIRNHAMGAVWVDPMDEEKAHAAIEKIKSAADYPILIFCDAESGLQEFTIGKHNAVGCTDSRELAYTFGKVTALVGRRIGYNVICNPILDITKVRAVCGGNVRTLGSDKYRVAELAAEIARGMHDAGVLTVGKHYPSGQEENGIDSHMAEPISHETEEFLRTECLYAYKQLNDAGLLDGIMTGHHRFINIDPDYPASLSSKVIGIIRDMGFDGFAITDALSMMGIVAKFGRSTSKGLAIAQGNDLALTWEGNRDGYEAILESYEKGILNEAQLDSAVRRVLIAQHKTLAEPKYTEITEEDRVNFDRINRESIAEIADEGIPASISRDGKHLFAVMVPNAIALTGDGKLSVATMIDNWYHPEHIMERLQAEFPNSIVKGFHEFSTPGQNMRILDTSVLCEDTVFITYMDCLAYAGRECFTPRVLSVMEAMQITNRISTVVHFGNPFVPEDIPHIPRLIFGNVGSDSVDYALDVLEGKLPAKGKLTFEPKLK